LHFCSIYGRKLLFFSQLNLPEITQVIHINININLHVKVVWLKIKYGLVLFIAQNRIIIKVVFWHNNCWKLVESLTYIFVI